MQFSFVAPLEPSPVPSPSPALAFSAVAASPAQAAPVIPLPGGPAARPPSPPPPPAAAVARTAPPKLVPGLQFVGVRREPAPLAPGEAPMLARAEGGEGDEKDKFRRDLAARPELADEEAYEAMPVGEFGKALLRGMGWSEGGSVGRSNRAAAPVIQYVPRPERLGLGAQPKKIEELPGAGDASKRRRIARPGEEPNARNVEYEQTVTADGKVKHYVDIDKGLVAKKKLEQKPGALVGIVDGVHEGMLGKITKLALDRSSVWVKLGSGEEVVVRAPQTVLLDSSLLQRQNGMDEVKRIMAAARKEVQQQDKSDVLKLRAKDDDNDESGGSKKSKKKKSGKKDKKSRKLATWLCVGIVVRCVSKTFQNGKLYQKKMVITDMPGPTTASAVLFDDRSKMVDNITQDLVETALPQVGGTVRFVSGDRLGELATLRERNSEKNRGMVQMDDDGTIESCSLDHIAQYIPMQ